MRAKGNIIVGWTTVDAGEPVNVHGWPRSTLVWADRESAEENAAEVEPARQLVRLELQVVSANVEEVSE